MQNYKDLNGNIHVLDSTEYEYLLPSGCIAITQEEADALSAPIPLTPKEKANNAIALLEASVTDRRLREAILGTDGGWLSNINAQIASMRCIR